MPVSEDRKFWAKETLCARVPRTAHTEPALSWYTVLNSHFTDDKVEAKVKEVAYGAQRWKSV